MVQELPTGKMDWCKNLNYERTQLGENNGQSSKTTGFVYEVDLKYPNNLHDKTKYFPFCPEKTKPGKLHPAGLSPLSKYQIENKDKHYKPTEKLILNQNDKKNYVIEGRMLDWYLDHGIILDKTPEAPTGFHKKLKYKKSKWLKPYSMTKKTHYS